MLEQYPDILTVKDLQDILSIGRSKAYAILHGGELQIYNHRTANPHPEKVSAGLFAKIECKN